MTNEMALVPILEEPKNGLQMAAYKPDASLADQRKAKNEALKAKVRMLKASERLETGSVASGENTFITGTNLQGKHQAKKKKRSYSSSSNSSSSDGAPAAGGDSLSQAIAAVSMLNKGK